MIRAVVFDIGGVLLRTEDPSIRQRLGDKFGLQTGELENLVFNSQPALASTIGQVTEKAIWEYVARELNLSPEKTALLKEAFWAGDQVDQTLLKFLQKCREEYITALLSNAWVGARSFLAEEYGITEGETVDRILFSSELGVAKPDPLIYQLLAKTLNCNYGEILFVDDFIENVKAARQLGIHAIHYHHGLNLISKVSQKLNQA